MLCIQMVPCRSRITMRQQKKSTRKVIKSSETFLRCRRLSIIPRRTLDPDPALIHLKWLLRRLRPTLSILLMDRGILAVQILLIMMNHGLRVTNNLNRTNLNLSNRKWQRLHWQLNKHQKSPKWLGKVKSSIELGTWILQCRQDMQTQNTPTLI